MTMQGPLTQWVTDHRKHHALSDKPGDPHSPHVGHGDGVLGAARGFVHAHVGWLFSNLGMEQGREYGRTSTTTACSAWIDRPTCCGWRSHSGSRSSIGYWLGGTWRAGSRASSGAG